MGWALCRSRVATAAALVAFAGRALADAPGWLGWSAPVECQNTPEVERRLTSLLGHSVDSATLPPTLVRMGWSAEQGWSVRVTVQLAAGPRDRSLDVPSCADALDVIALSLALILDPSLDADGAGAEPARASGDAAGDAPGDAAPADDGQAQAPMAELEPAPPGAATELPPGSERALAAGDGSSVDPRRVLKLSAGGGPLTDLAIFPVPQFGAGLYAGLGAGAFRLELEGDLLASESARFDGGLYPVTFHSYFGALRGCYTLEVSSRFGWVGCAGGELGSLGTHEQGGDEHRAAGLLAAAEASTGPEFAATPRLRAFARIRVASPLIRHEFLLSEGSRVHELPWLSPALQVGIVVDVTDLDAGGHSGRGER